MDRYAVVAHRLGLHAHLVELEVLAIERRLFLCPQRSQDLERFVRSAGTCARVNAASEPLVFVLATAWTNVRLGPGASAILLGQTAGLSSSRGSRASPRSAQSSSARASPSFDPGLMGIVESDRRTTVLCAIASQSVTQGPLFGDIDRRQTFSTSDRVIGQNSVLFP